MRNFAKTKILCTLGPASESPEVMSALIDAGIDAFRLNFSHGSYEVYQKIFHRINEVRIKKSLPISILIDLQGPKIRVGELEEKIIPLKKGEKIEITTKQIKGNKNIICTSYNRLSTDAEIGDRILIDDGLIELKVLEKTDHSVICEIIEGGLLKPKKGMNLPGMKLTTTSVTRKDFNDLKFALENGIDFVALSFVRQAEDVVKLRNWIKKQGYNIPIIAKIEKPEAVDNFDEILEVSDGIMVARGDLGVEMEAHDVPIIQKTIISKTKAVGKMVITATQMLESMISNPVPTRAEATDIANAVWDGTDVVMLSGETSVGAYPVEAVKRMNDIVRSAESHPEFKVKIEHKIPKNLPDNLFDSHGKALSNMSRQTNAAAIVVFTEYGRKARVISKYHPEAPVIAISNRFNTLNNLNLHWGIMPLFFKDIKEEENATAAAIKLLTEENLVKQKDVIIVTAGAPVGEEGRRNWTRYVII
ncbi:MAG: pyruvate kinase [Melioribacteraceae bacterium]|nr:pyruvate kinase [Melioribacteraceae bacterium]MCF8263589.1 pyruvate kinase [Melioribacteraceae bacterium]MCF8412418.1 pyruvate kinase [Melioribacteraceae bacterium]MCF8432190.1 pyruvate kinase [Melioribacteraceae bacterium]